MNIYLGIDIGGSNIKITAINDEYTSLGFGSIKTPPSKTGGAIRMLVGSFLDENHLSDAPIKSIGVGIPGIVEGYTGPVVYTPNLNIENSDLCKLIAKEISDIKGKEFDYSRIFLENDANCAGIAEAASGAGKDYETVMLLTLGTGLGGCIIKNNLPLPLGKYGGEFGHFPFIYGGKKCACGIKGCFEQYANAKASHELGFEKYTEYLAAGITGLVNIFRPDIVLLAGGVTNEGQKLPDAINKNMSSLVYAREHVSPPPVMLASLGNKAGAMGAAILGKLLL